MRLKTTLAGWLEWYGTHMHHRGQWRVMALLLAVCGIDIDEDREVERGGLRWVLNPSNLVEANLFWMGTSDCWDVEHARRLLRPGAVVFDVGANFGYYTCTLARYLERNCRVYAFEPVSTTCQRLRRNIASNSMDGCVRVFELGLSDHDGSGRLEVFATNTGAAHFTGEPGDIALTTLDHFCRREGVSGIDLMKIDVEGFESPVLRGARETIDRFHPSILIELHPMTQKRMGLSVRDVADELTGRGYRLFVSRRHRLVPLVELPSGDDFVNAFALHPSRVPDPEAVGCRLVS